MKKVVSGKFLQDKMVEAIELLCTPVKLTLGPKGHNVIIDHSSFCPFITNDGVTIASNIESDDAATNTILELAKEASIKTDENVGDGTTTTLVLLESIFKSGLELINNGQNPLVLKKQLDKAKEVIMKEIDNLSFKPSLAQLENIATISANNDEEIGKIVAQAYQKVGAKDAIVIRETEGATSLEFVKGYTLNTTLASPFFLKSNNTISWPNPHICLIEDTLDDIEIIAPLINEISQKQEALVIIAEDYTEEVANEIISLYLNQNIKIALLKITEYGTNYQAVLADLKAILNNSNLGRIKDIEIQKEKIIWKFNSSPYLKEYLKSLKTTNNSYDKEILNRRLAMLKKGMAYINVGGTTTTERREKKMRFDDALCSICSAKDNITLGSGLTFYQISENLPLDNDAYRILKKTLQQPFKQIMENSALDEEIIKEIKKDNYTKVYNVTLDKFEDLKSTSVWDASLVIKNALANAISIAGMLLTTSTLIINEYQNNLNKVNDYNEL